MLRSTLAIMIPLISSSLIFSESNAAILYESGALGGTGVSFLEVDSQTVLGSVISPVVFNGVRFELDQPAMATGVGGHFIWNPNSSTKSFFGAVIDLTGAADFPDSSDLSTPDVLAAVQLEFPEVSAVVHVDVSLSLEPGWYALVFGSGLFGASGSGAALLNNTDIGMPSYIGYQPVSDWTNSSTPFSGYNFFVNGNIVPEPAWQGLLFIFCLRCSLLRCPRT